MVAVKPAQAKAFTSKPPDNCKAVLVYGTDAGLIKERVTQLSKCFAARSQPNAEIVRINDIDLEDTPDKILVELQTISMFGEGKVVKVTLGGRITGAMVKSIVQTGPFEADLVVEGGNLKTRDAVRKVFEITEWAAALPCFADTQHDLSLLIDEMMKQDGHVLDNEAKQILLYRLGADRAQSRGEIEKLILFAGSRKKITSNDVVAIVGEASGTAIDTIIKHVANGRVVEAVNELTRTVGVGENPQTVILAIQRHFRRLHFIRGAIDEGKSFDDAVRALRPPLFFKQKDDMAAQCRKWTILQLNSALKRIFNIIKLARYNANLEYELAERLVLELATIATENRRR